MVYGAQSMLVMGILKGFLKVAEDKSYGDSVIIEMLGCRSCSEKVWHSYKETTRRCKREEAF